MCKLRRITHRVNPGFIPIMSLYPHTKFHKSCWDTVVRCGISRIAVPFMYGLFLDTNGSSQLLEYLDYTELLI